MTRDQIQGHLAMLAFSALVAGSFSLGTRVANDISPLALNAARFWVAALVIGGMALATKGLPRSAYRAPWRYLVLGGLFACYFALMFEGLKTAPPVSAAAVFTLTPVVTAVAAWVLLRQVTGPRILLGLAIGAVGASWVIFRADLSALLAFDVGRGEAIYFAGCVAHAVYTPMLRKLNRGESAVSYTFGMLVAGGLCLTVIGWSDIRATDWAGLPSRVWVALAYLALAASAASFLLLQIGSMRLPSSKVMAYTYLTPSWVLIWEIALRGPVPPVAVLWGVALSVIALLWLARN